jgi:hypothetical protein
MTGGPWHLGVEGKDVGTCCLGCFLLGALTRALKVLAGLTLLTAYDTPGHVMLSWGKAGGVS